MDNTINLVIMHVNFGKARCTSYRTKTVDGVCKMASTIGYEGIEFRSARSKSIEYYKALVAVF